MEEPEDTQYILAMTAPSDGILYQRDDENAEGSLKRWFALSDPDDVYAYEDMKTDYDTLIRMEAVEWHDTGR